MVRARAARRGRPVHRIIRRQALFTTEDETFATPGKVALWTKADSVTDFDTISIAPLD
jgi:hypothetical protein